MEPTRTPTGARRAKLARTLRLTHPVTGQALELRSRRRLETLPR